MSRQGIQYLDRASAASLAGRLTAAATALRCSATNCTALGPHADCALARRIEALAAGIADGSHPDVFSELFVARFRKSGGNLFACPHERR